MKTLSVKQGFGSELDPNSIGLADPDPGRLELATKEKMKKFHA